MLTSASQVMVLVLAMLAYAAAAALRVGMVSLAPPAFLVISGYATGILLLRFEWDFVPTVIVVTLGTILVAALLALPLLRLTGVFAALATFAFFIMVSGLVLSLDITGRDIGIIGIPSADTRPLLVVALALTVIGWYVIDHTHVGRMIDLVGSDPVQASSFGVNVALTRFLVLSYAGLSAGIAGAAYAHNLYAISPTTFPFHFAVTVAGLAIIGGAGHWLTPLIAAFTVGLIPMVFSHLGNWALLVQGGLMASIVVFWPQGIAGILRRLSLPGAIKAMFGKSPAERARGKVLAWL